MATTNRHNPKSNKQQRFPQKNKPQPLTQETPLSSKKGFYILLALLGGMILFVFHDFFLLNKVFLYKDIGSDSITQLHPLAFHIADYVQNMGGIPRWSFYQGMGQYYLGNTYGDPFFLLCTLVKPENVAYMLSIVGALQCFAAGVFFYLFLRELRLAPYTAMTGAMSVAFCGYIGLTSTWYMPFAMEIYQAAFLFFAVEKLLHKKWYYFPFAIALIGASAPFNLFIYSLAVGIYVFVRWYSQYGWSRKIIAVYGQLIGLGALGVGIGAFILISKVELMLNSPRGSGEAAYFSQLWSMPLFQPDGLLANLTKIGRLFSNGMLGTGNHFAPAAGLFNYMEAPAYYMGLVALLLCTQIFPMLSKRKKRIVITVIAGALLPFVFPFFRHALWLFTGDYYRGLSFLFALLLQVLAMLSLNRLAVTRKINFKILFGTLLTLILLLYFPNIIGIKHPALPDAPLFQPGLQSFCLLFLLLYAALLCLLAVKNIGRYVQPLIIGLLFIELTYMARITFYERDVVTYGEMKGKRGYNDYTMEAVQYIQQIDTAFFRIQKDYGSSLAMHKSLNDPVIQRFYGTTSYLSFNQNNYTRFLLAAQVIPADNEFATRWIEGLTLNRPLLQIFGNVRYNLSKTPLPPEALLLNDSINKMNDVYIYKTKFTLPFGYTYSHYLPRSAFDSLSFKDVALLEAAVIDDADTANYAALQRLSRPIAQEQYLLENLAADVDSLRQETFQMTYFSQNKIQGNITLQKDKLLFFTIPFDKGWKVVDNGVPLTMQQVNIGFSGVLLSAGNHDLELRFDPFTFRMGLIISIISLLLTGVIIGWFYWLRPNGYLVFPANRASRS